MHEIEHPLIRGDIRFAGWKPVDEAEIQRICEEMLIRPARRAKRQTIILVPAASTRTEATQAKIISRIVGARKPRPQR